jgi:hypothetical protein
MSRVNTVSWADGKVLTKLMGELQRDLMDWQMYAFDVVTAGKPCNSLGGDSGVLVSAIRLRDRLNEVISKSANAPKVGK